MNHVFKNIFFNNKTFKAWFIFSVAVCFYFLCCLQRVAPAVIVDDFMRFFSVGAGAYGLMAASYFYVYAGLQIPAGLVLDRFGIVKPMALASLFCAFGVLIFSLAPNYYLSFLGRAVIGAGAGFSWIGILKLSALWFPRNKYASLIGFGQAVGIFGAIAGQAPLAYFNKIYNWQDVMFFLAVAGFIVFLFMILSIFAEKELEDKKSSNEKTKMIKSIIISLSNIKIWYPIAFGAFTATGLWAFGGLWGASFLEKAKGLSQADAAFASSCVFIGAMFGCPVLGYLSDKYQKRKIFAVMCNIFAFIFLMLIIFVNMHLYLIYLLIMCAGCAFGGAFLSFVMVKEASLANYIGVSLGIANTILMGTSSIIQPIAGSILDFFWKGDMHQGLRIYDNNAWTYAILIFPICQLIALIGSLNIKEDKI